MTRETRDADASGPLVRTAATWFGLGHARFAPGTLAALTMLPVHWLLERGPRPLEIAVAIALAAVGVWAANRAAHADGERDPDHVVIDEAAGALLALAVASGHGMLGDVLAVGLFRLFDIYKPWPIIAFERIEHRGAAIMLDDIAAGLLAGLVVSLF
jgi:phosphatidylglycerophosphatase A